MLRAVILVVMGDQTTLYKTERDTIPVRISPAWRKELHRMAGELNTSDNAVYSLVIRIGAPILAANLQNLRQSVRKTAQEIGSGKQPFAKCVKL